MAIFGSDGLPALASAGRRLCLPSHLIGYTWSSSQKLKCSKIKLKFSDSIRLCNQNNCFTCCFISLIQSLRVLLSIVHTFSFKIAWNVLFENMAQRFAPSVTNQVRRQAQTPAGAGRCRPAITPKNCRLFYRFAPGMVGHVTQKYNTNLW